MCAARRDTRPGCRERAGKRAGRGDAGRTPAHRWNVTNIGRAASTSLSSVATTCGAGACHSDEPNGPDDVGARMRADLRTRAVSTVPSGRSAPSTTPSTPSEWQSCGSARQCPRAWAKGAVSWHTRPGRHAGAPGRHLNVVEHDGHLVVRVTKVAAPVCSRPPARGRWHDVSGTPCCARAALQAMYRGRMRTITLQGPRRRTLSRTPRIMPVRREWHRHHGTRGARLVPGLACGGWHGWWARH